MFCSVGANHAAIGKTRRQTLIEVLVVITVIAILIALLFPQTKWASSGDLNLPVKILVFDAASATPIVGAKVLLFRASPWFDDQFLSDFHDRFTAESLAEDKKFSGVTDANGVAVINYRFATGANHERPTPHAHTASAWTAVQATGYGTVIVQIRSESMPTKQLKEQKELRIPIGLLPIE